MRSPQTISLACTSVFSSFMILINFIGYDIVEKFWFSKKKKQRKKKLKMIVLRKKIGKTAKAKYRFCGEESLGPQASSRVTPCPPAPNHTRGEVIRPPSQIENNSYSVIRTRDLDDLSCTRCAPTIAARPSRKYTFNMYKLSV